MVETVGAGGPGGDGPGTFAGTCRDMAGPEQGLFPEGLVVVARLFFSAVHPPSLTGDMGKEPVLAVVHHPNHTLRKVLSTRINSPRNGTLQHVVRTVIRLYLTTA